MKFWLILSLLLVVACEARPKRPTIKGKGDAVSDPSGTNGGGGTTDQTQAELESNTPLDLYMFIGPYLQKELDNAASAGNIVKVYVQMRQELDVLRAYDSMKTTLKNPTPEALAAIDTAKSRGASTVEFDILLSSLKDSMDPLKNVASSLELSVPNIK